MNRKLSFALFFVASFWMMSLLSIDTHAVDYTPKVCDDGKVVLHYQKLDGDYTTSIGVWTWNNGTGGSSDQTLMSGTDDFGAVIEICVNTQDAGNTGNFIPLSAEADNDGRWGYKDSYNGMDMEYDRTALIDGTTNELHIYFISGNDRVFMNEDGKPMFDKDGFGTLTILYLDPTAITNPDNYNGWNIWTWQTGTDGTTAPAPFQWDYYDPMGLKMKVAVINVAADADDTVGFIVRTDNWDKKWGSDIFIDVSDIKGSGHKTVYYVAGKGDVRYSFEDYTSDLDNEIIPMDLYEATGTFIKEDHQSINLVLKFPAFTSDIASLVTVKDGPGYPVTISSITPVNETNGKATVFTIALENPLSKVLKYFVELNNVGGKVLHQLQYLTNVFVGFDPIESTGTYASTVSTVEVEVKRTIDVSTADTKFEILDGNGDSVAISSITPLNEVDGKASKFTINLENPLDKASAYVLSFNDEIETDLDIDNTAPMISYTNKVKLDQEKYDQDIDTFLIEKGTTFNLEDYIRLNIVDDRDGSLVDLVEITGTPDTNVVGSYTLKISVKDEWDNVSEMTFNFKVYDEEQPPQETTTTEEQTTTTEDNNTTDEEESSNGTMIIIIAGAIAVFGTGLFLFFRPKK